MDEAWTSPSETIKPASANEPYARALCRRYDWAIDCLGEHDLPAGWRWLTESLFEALALVMAGQDRSEAVVVRRLARESGHLAVGISLVGHPNALWRGRAVSLLAKLTRQASTTSCGVCGDRGQRREGCELPLCDLHAADRPEEAAHEKRPARSNAPIRGRDLRGDPPPDVSPRESGTDRPEPVTGLTPERLALYALADVGAALGDRTAPADPDDDAFDGDPPSGFAVRRPSDTDQQAPISAASSAPAKPPDGGAWPRPRRRP